MALQFKPDGAGGFLYRRDQFGPGLPATAAERDRYVSWYGWMVLLGGLLYFFGIVIGAIIFDAMSGGRDLGPGSAVAAGVGALAALYLFLRWMSHAPARAFAGRALAAPALSRKQVLGKHTARIRYRRIIPVCAGMAAMMAIVTRDHPGALWLAIGLPAAIGLGFVAWKWRIESGD